MPRPKFHAAEATKKGACGTTHYAGLHVRARPAFRRSGVRIAFALAAALVTATLPALGACIARSGPETAALVELYTSEGCSSCPPADRWLTSLPERYAPSQVVPLALHVDYWDYIGWKDPFAKREFSQRQRRLSQLQRAALVYTPQVLLQGADFPQWGSTAFDNAVARINARPARAALELQISEIRPATLVLRASAAVSGGTSAADALVYVATYENRLESRITAGENRGRVLHHDHVVLEWRGPYGLGTRELELALLPKAKSADSGVVAFVQNRRTGEVLQALSLAACTAAGF